MVKTNIGKLVLELIKEDRLSIVEAQCILAAIEFVAAHVTAEEAGERALGTYFHGKIINVYNNWSNED